MRILLFGDRPYEGTPWGRFARTVVDRAPLAGHEARVLPAQGDWSQPGNLGGLAAGAGGPIDAYRSRLRSALDAVVESFNPDLIHAQHLWIPAHLALETGVPYVVSTWAEELPAYRADPRFRIFTEQAAENAGSMVADSEATRREIVAAFGELEGRVIVVPDIDDSLEWLWQLYDRVIAQRRGDSACREADL